MPPTASTTPANRNDKIKIAFGNGYYEFFQPCQRPFCWPPRWGAVPWAGCYAPKGIPVANTPGELTEFFKAVPPEATLELFAHGNPTAIYATFCESPEEQVITTQTLPSIFKPLKDKRLRCVTLHACEVGARPKQAGQLNFAQTLSDYLQTTVYGSPFLSRGIFGFYGGLYNQYQNGQFKGLRWCW